MQYTQHRRDVLKRCVSIGSGYAVVGIFLSVLIVSAASDDVADYPETLQTQLRAAHRAFQAEEWHKAFRLYRELTEIAPDFPIFYIGKGDAAVKLRDYPTAINTFQRALQLFATQPESNATAARLQVALQAKLAAAYHRNKQLDEADKWFQKAVKDAGEDAPVGWYVALGQIETERGNLEQARRYYIVAVQLNPGTTAAYNNLGHVLLKLDRLDEADAVFREALTQDETLASAAFGRGEVSARRGQPAIARRFYERAIQHAPDEPIFHESLATVLREMGSISEAEAVESRYRRTLAKRYRRQAHRFIENGQPERALVPLQKAVEADTRFTAALQDYGYVQMQLGQLAAARHSYQRVLAMAPTSRQALLHLGMIAAQLGDPAAATAHYLTLIQHEPDFMDTYVELANLHERAGDLGAAAQTLTLGLEHVPTWAPGYLWRGKIYGKQRNVTLAEKDFRNAVQLAPGVPFPKDALASLLAWESRDLSEALALAESAMKSDAQPRHRATLALVYYRLNRMIEARREIEIAFTENPKHPYVLKIRAKILKSDP